MMIARFLPFFLILLFWLRNNVQSQQQKNKVRFGRSLRGEVVGGSVAASSFGWFQGGFRWFPLVEGDFGWFQMVCCFTSYINFKALFTVLMVACDWLRSFDFFIQSKTARKKNYCCLVPRCLKISDHVLYSTVFYARWKASFKENFLKKQSQNTKQVGVLQNIWDESFGEERLKNFKNRETIRTHEETGRNEPKWGDLPVGWRETPGL